MSPLVSMHSDDSLIASKLTAYRKLSDWELLNY